MDLKNGMRLKCAMYCLFVLNICLVIFSFVSIGIGLILRNVFEITDALFKTKTTLLSSFAIWGGVAMFVIVMIGCYGAVLENSLMILTFSVLMTIVVALDLYPFIRILVGPSKYWWEDSEMKQNLNDSMNEYDSNENVQSAWDVFQKSLKCCGVDNYTDWGEKIPKSCCKEKIEDNVECPTGKIFTEGCWKKMSGSSGDQRKGIGVYGIFTFLFFISAIVNACFLAAAIKKQQILPEQQSVAGENQQTQPSFRDGESVRTGISNVRR